MTAFIEEWLSRLHPAPCELPINDLSSTLARPPLKRKRRGPLTPPLSIHAMDNTPTKRPRYSEDELDETPRARRTQSSHASSRSSQSQSQSQSHGSTTSSPRKKLARLGLHRDGIKIRLLAIKAPDMRDELSAFLVKLRPYCNGIRVVPASRRAEFESSISPDLLSPENFAPPASDEEPFPSVDALMDVVDWAQICQEDSAEEAAWNSAVHFKVLSLALFNGSRPKTQKVGFKQCTTAEIIKGYRTSAASGKKVDFAMYLEPNALGISDTIYQLQSTMLAESINHTDYEPLLSRPITASIETKRENAGTDDAQLQLSTWQASQWNMLEAQLRFVHSGTPSPQDIASEKLKQLPFLPGIIIAGHDWYLVATTRDNSNTVFWARSPFGSTRDIIELCKVIHGIQLLQRWSETVFWPWYRDNIIAVKHRT